MVMGSLQGLGRVPFLNERLGLFNYPGSARALLAGTLLLRYCAARFACRTPTWRLPVSGQVAWLVTADLGVADDDGVEGVGSEVCWVSGSGPGRKRIRLHRKPPAHLVGLTVRSRPRVWKRLDHVGDICVSIPDRKRRRRDQDDVGNVPAQIRTGVGKFPGLCRPASPGLHVFNMQVAQVHA